METIKSIDGFVFDTKDAEFFDCEAKLMINITTVPNNILHIVNEAVNQQKEIFNHQFKNAMAKDNKKWSEKQEIKYTLIYEFNASSMNPNGKNKCILDVFFSDSKDYDLFDSVYIPFDDCAKEQAKSIILEAISNMI